MTSDTLNARGGWTIETAIQQIEKCSFECEGGPLAHNDAWRWLKTYLGSGPALLLGQPVWYEVSAEALGVKMTQWVQFYVAAIRASSDSERRTWEYDITTQMPSAYYAGGHVVKNVAMKNIRFSDPTKAVSHD